MVETKIQMKKAQAQSVLPRPRPSSGSSSRNNGGSSSSSNGGGEDRSLDMRSLNDTLPETSALRYTLTLLCFRNPVGWKVFWETELVQG